MATMFDQLLDRASRALAAAANALYFADNSDYRSALWEAVAALSTENFADNPNYLDEVGREGRDPASLLLEVLEASDQATDPALGGRVAVWDAIHEYVRACGGDPDSGVYGNTRRQRAVVRVEEALARAR